MSDDATRNQSGSRADEQAASVARAQNALLGGEIEAVAFMVGKSPDDVRAVSGPTEPPKGASGMPDDPTRSHTATPTRCEHEPGCDCLTVPKGATWDQTVTVLTRRGCAALHRDGVGRVEVRQVEAGVRAALEGVARAKYVQDVIAALEKSGG